jgi:hypothetical protein
MFTLILIATTLEKPPSASELLVAVHGIRYEYTDSCLVEGESRQEDGWIRISRDDEIKNDYDSGELESAGIVPNESAFFLVEGGNGARNYSAEFLHNLPTNKHYIIDNDHGCIGDVAKFQNLLLRGEKWLYSKSF